MDMQAPLVTNVTRWLDAAAVPYRAHRHVPVLNAQQALEHGLGFDPGTLLKTLVFRRPAGYALVVLGSTSRLAVGALARALGIGRDRLAMLQAEELRSVFGWEPGAASPVPVVESADVWVDAVVLGLQTVYFGGGRPDLTLEAAGALLWDAVPHRVAALSGRPP